ncbi:vasodilator-stimulated phosphoprotein-like [Amphibalanus amphitrite]|uniref:vasodilator-stimulated phosphoprotein-like n=1 Tax=Amphibalanus amphitrite TaxID=1232801 RepID=UPI001C9262B5|nr:vasodilator-stimulated phosphoprotein-like [Amphibalanus amphitrite]XP_043244308.1 vasodilator-stimulated phosphoprotein-like [Amphibalanus amphitrite]
MAMTLIEGVGDEVTLFFVLALLAVVACLAWWTTRVADRPLRIQTIIVGQRVIHVDESGEPTTAAAAAAAEGAGAGPPPQPPPPPAGPTEPAEPSCEEDEDGEVELVQREDLAGEAAAADSSSGEGGTGAEGSTEAGAAAAESGTTSQGAAAESGPESVNTGADGGSADGGSESSSAPAAAAEDRPESAPEDGAGSDPASSDPIPDPTDDVRMQLRQRRLAFMARQAASPDTRSEEAARTAAADTERIAPDTERTTANTAERTTADTDRTAADTADRTATDTTDRAAETEAPSENSQTIVVKLKFLNDTQRLVEGRRAEPLADFKRRHFPTETAANRIVRLIFNGRVLPDQETLSQCGLYHNCVVHCHVSAHPRPAAGGGAAGGAAAGGGAPAELDIGVLLYPVLTSVVTLVWGLRLRYPELFSGTAVLLLAVLTLLLACFAAATFLPLDRLPGGAAAGRQQQRGR